MGKKPELTDVHRETLIDLVYSTIEEPIRWKLVTDYLSNLMGDGCVALFAHSDPETYSSDLAILSGLDDSFLMNYALHYGRENCFVQHAFDRYRPGDVYADWEILPRSVSGRTAYFNELCKPANCAHGLAATVYRDESAQVFLSMLGPVGLNQEFILELKELVGRLMPHIRRAIEVRVSVEKNSLRSISSSKVLDSLGCAYLVTDGEGKVLACSPAAQAMLETGRRIGVDRNGRIVGACPRRTSELREIVKRVVERDTLDANRYGGLVTLSEPHEPVKVFANVLSSTVRDTGEENLARIIGPGDRRALVILNPEPRLNDGFNDALQVVYGLSAAEADIVSGLCSGLSLADCATMRSSREQTVRKQIKNVFQKLGVSSQSALVARVLRELSFSSRSA